MADDASLIKVPSGASATAEAAAEQVGAGCPQALHEGSCEASCSSWRICAPAGLCLHMVTCKRSRVQLGSARRATLCILRGPQGLLSVSPPACKSSTTRGPGPGRGGGLHKPPASSPLQLPTGRPRPRRALQSRSAPVCVSLTPRLQLTLRASCKRMQAPQLRPPLPAYSSPVLMLQAPQVSCAQVVQTQAGGCSLLAPDRAELMRVCDAPCASLRHTSEV